MMRTLDRAKPVHKKPWASLIAIAALVLLASCAETPSKPTTSGGSSSGSGKIVTATPEETFECDDDLILEPHLPEECIPPEPPEPVVQESVEPPKPDPIVGTYRLFTTRTEKPFRVYANGTAGSAGRVSYRWERDGDVYHFLVIYSNGSVAKRPRITMKYQSIKGEPDLVATPATTPDAYWYGAEGLKLSDDPRHRFDLFQVQCRREYGKCFETKQDADGKSIRHSRIETTSDGKTYTAYFKEKESRGGWTCFNVGQRIDDDEVYWVSWGLYGDAPFHADSLSECLEICENALLNDFETISDGNCSDYQG